MSGIWYVIQAALIGTVIGLIISILMKLEK